MKKVLTAVLLSTMSLAASADVTNHMQEVPMQCASHERVTAMLRELGEVIVFRGGSTFSEQDGTMVQMQFWAAETGTYTIVLRSSRRSCILTEGKLAVKGTRV